jgi:multidrug efflux pump subunit AcrA (membrane-fusion protein)
MKTKKTSVPEDPKQLQLQIAVAQKQADAAKRSAKLAKLDLRLARQKYKDAKRVAKKLRKAVKALRADLEELRKKKKPGRPPVARKPAVRRARLVAPPAPVLVPEPQSVPPEAEPTTAGIQ